MCLISCRERLCVCVTWSTWGCTCVCPRLLMAATVRLNSVERFWTHVRSFHVLWGCRPRACSQCELKAQQGHLSLDSTPIELPFLPAVFQREALKKWRGKELWERRRRRRSRQEDGGREGKRWRDKGRSCIHSLCFATASIMADNWQ